MVGAGHSTYTDRFHELARLVPHLVTPETKRIKRYIYGLALQIRGMLAATEPPTIYNAILKAGVLTDEVVRNGSLKINGGESSKEGNVKSDNKRARTGKVFAIITNPDFRAGPRMMNPLNARNPIAAYGTCYECGGTDDYNFVSTTFVPLLDIDPSSLGFGYEIEIASRQLVEINKIIRGFKLDIERHTFDIDLMPFGHRSFDVIIGMDWLSRDRAKIVCLEKVVRILLSRVEELKLKDIAIVRNFSEGFHDNISGLPPSREVEFRIDLIPGAMPVAKSPYRLAPTEMDELSNQLSDGINVDPSKIEAVKNWEAPKSPTKVWSFLEAQETKTELTLEQTQQGVSDDVLVSIEGVEELKRNVKIKGEKKEALLTLRQKPG
ncbi:putative reverse transcriptase domain-containing protein [Tanacetum coccineum]